MSFWPPLLKTWWRSRLVSLAHSTRDKRRDSGDLQGQSLTLSQLGRLDTRLGRLFADAVLALMRRKSQTHRRHRHRLPWTDRMA